jgi:hypothetical protein
MSDDVPTNPPSRADVLRASLWQATQDLLEGRITPTEANRITKRAGRELRRIEALLRTAKIAQKLNER